MTTESSPTTPRYCFCIPYQHHHNPQQTLWSRGLHALKNLRQWSEIVIRKFNRNKHLGQQPNKLLFQYDPLGYALNFDEGALESGDSEMENEYLVRSFSSRYASTAVLIGDKTSSD
ncbi:hypothetical protein Hanom_Chr07g00594191 [Helianthus anomalus]